MIQIGDKLISKSVLMLLNRRLDTAEKSGDPDKVIDVCNYAFKVFDSAAPDPNFPDDGLPDCWVRFENARENAFHAIAAKRARELFAKNADRVSDIFHSKLGGN